MAALAAFRHAVIFIELHDWAVVDGRRKPARLLTDAREPFDVTEVRTTSRGMFLLPELQVLGDGDRVILCSEGRARLMTWLRLDPRTAAGALA